MNLCRLQIADCRLAALAALAVAVGMLLVPGDQDAGARAEEKKMETVPGSTKVDPLTEIQVVERVRQATARGLEYLRAQQQPDGSWTRNHAVNALALLAFMGRGHTPGRGPYRDVLQKGRKFLLTSANPATGFVSFSTMYEHGLATLCLAEMYGMDPDPDVEVKLRKAVELIVKCQSPAGG
jgi:hypothetical protein